MNAADKTKALAFLRNLAKLMELHGVTEIGGCSCCDGVGISGADFGLSNVRIDGVTISADEFICEPRVPGPEWRELVRVCTEGGFLIHATSEWVRIQHNSRALVAVKVADYGNFEGACAIAVTELRVKGWMP